MEVCFLMVEKAPFGVCYDCYTSAVFGEADNNSMLISTNKLCLLAPRGCGHKVTAADTLQTPILFQLTMKGVYYRIYTWNLVFCQ